MNNPLPEPDDGKIFKESEYRFSILRFSKVSAVGFSLSIPFIVNSVSKNTIGIPLIVSMVSLLPLSLLLLSSYATGQTFSTYGRINIAEHKVNFLVTQVILTAVICFVGYLSIRSMI